MGFEKLKAGIKVGEVELTVDELFDLPPVDEGAKFFRLQILIRRQRRGLPVKAMRINLPFACEPAVRPDSTNMLQAWCDWNGPLILNAINLLRCFHCVSESIANAHKCAVCAAECSSGSTSSSNIYSRSNSDDHQVQVDKVWPAAFSGGEASIHMDVHMLLVDCRTNCESLLASMARSGFHHEC